MRENTRVQAARWRRNIALPAAVAIAAAWVVVASPNPAGAVDVTVTSVSEFYDAIDDANASVDAVNTITLGANIVWDSSWLTYSNTGDFVLDGAGHTITFTSSAVGFLDAESTAGDVDVFDLTINGSGASTSLQAVLSLTADASVGTATLTDVVVENVTGNWTPVALHGHELYVDDSSFSGNSAASGGGGALYLNTASESGTFVSGSSFLNNEAIDGSGGAIYSEEDLEVDNSYFSGNQASVSGGAIYEAWGWFEAYGSTFTDNSADSGGAVYVNDDYSHVDTSLFDGNTATFDGGAIRAYFYGDSFSSTFVSNETGRNGGAIYTEGADDYSYHWNSTFDHNVAEENGGAIYADSYYVEAWHTTFTDNEAGEDGAHVFVSDDYFQTYASVFAGAVGSSGCYAYDNVTSYGFNFDFDGSCTDDWDSTGDFGDGSAPHLGALGDNGGPTPTRLPAADSVLIDHIDSTTCEDAIDGGSYLEHDQRGVDRLDMLDAGDEGCDVGAVEVIPYLIYNYYDGPTLIATATITNALDWDCGDTYTVAELGGTPPAGVTFPWGGFDWCILLPGQGWPSTVTWNFPSPVNQMWKIDDDENWSLVGSATFSGTTVTYTITDGDSFDADGSVDGFIYDPAAPGIGASFTG